MKTQYNMYYQKIEDRMIVTEQFFRVQNSDNPLSEDEIKSLINKRPDKYGHLKAFLVGDI